MKTPLPMKVSKQEWEKEKKKWKEVAKMFADAFEVNVEIYSEVGKKLLCIIEPTVSN